MQRESSLKAGQQGKSAAFKRESQGIDSGAASTPSFLQAFLGQFTKFGSAAVVGGGGLTSASHSTPLEVEDVTV